MVCIKSLILFGVVSGVIFLGCEKSTPISEKSYGDSLVIVTYHAPTGINPVTSIAGISSLLTEVVFDGLVQIDEELEARPLLASSWQVSHDGLRWTFFLRKGVRFHDGLEFTAEDVHFTLEEIMHSGSIGLFTGVFSNLVRSIQVKDRYTIEIILNKPSMFFIYSMAAGILPAHLLKEKGSKERFGFHPVGTGPFRLGEWKENEIVFEANKDYFLGRPYLDNIVIKVYPDQEMAWARLMRGDGDMLFPVDPAVYDLLRQVSSLQVYKTQGLNYSLITFNNNRKLFADKKVRVALNYAIDKEYIIQDVLKGKGQIASGTIGYNSLFYNPAVKPYPYDPQKALSLLKEAGWRDTNGDHILDKDGKDFIFTLVINEGDEIKGRTAMHIQQQLGELGIIVNIKPLSASASDFLFQGKFDAVFLDIWSHVYPDFSYNIWHSSQIGRGLNIGHYRSARVDELLEKGRLSKDTEEARQIYYQFQEEMHHDPPGIFLYWGDRLISIHKRFRGVRFPPVKIMSSINTWYVPERDQKYRR